jgi:polygalacturonase
MKSTCILSVLLLLAPAFVHAGDDPMSRFQAPRVREPEIPRRAVRITDFGAVPDGQTLNTEAIARAIRAVAGKGGGKVVVPPGLWLTGPIQLKSKVQLHLEEGALVQFTSDLSQYPLREWSIKGETATTATSPIWGENLTNVAITGRGVFDGAGDAWRPVKKSKMTEAQWKKLLATGGVLVGNGTMWWPSAEAAKDFRPRLLKLINCRRVLLEGVTFQNSPNWNLNPVLCEDLTLRRVTVRNPWYSQNGDGLDLEHCRNVIVRESGFDVGDDAICLKSGANAPGRRIGVPTENVLIEDCVVYHGHGGVTIGSEMSSGVRNVRVNNCLFMGTDIGLRFKSTRGRGGVVEKIYISNIRMTDIATDAIGFNMYYGGQAPTEAGEGAPSGQTAAPVDEGTPQFRDIHIQNVVCRGALQAVALQGLPEMPIRGIELRDISITAVRGLACIDAEDIALNNVEILNEEGAVLELTNSRDFRVDGLRFRPGTPVGIKAQGARLAGVVIRNTNLKAAGAAVEAGGGAAADAIRFE